MEMVSIRTNIPASRHVEIDLPKTVESGEAELIVFVYPAGGMKHLDSAGTQEQGRFERFFGILDEKDGRAFFEAHEDCERIDPRDWPTSD